MTVSYGSAWAIEQGLKNSRWGSSFFFNVGKPRACFLLGCMNSLKSHRDKKKHQRQMLYRRWLAVTAVSHS